MDFTYSALNQATIKNRDFGYFRLAVAKRFKCEFFLESFPEADLHIEGDRLVIRPYTTQQHASIAKRARGLVRLANLHLGVNHIEIRGRLNLLYPAPKSR